MILLCHKWPTYCKSYEQKTTYFLGGKGIMNSNTNKKMNEESGPDHSSGWIANLIALLLPKQVPLILPKHVAQNSSSRSSLLLLEYDSVNRNTNANAEGSEHSKSHCQLLVFHPVQVIHVLGMHVVWLIMPMSTHSLHSS